MSRGEGGLPNAGESSAGWCKTNGAKRGTRAVIIISNIITVSAQIHLKRTWSSGSNMPVWGKRKVAAGTNRNRFSSRNGREIKAPPCMVGLDQDNCSHNNYWK